MAATWPLRIGFTAVAESVQVEIDPSKRENGMSLRGVSIGLGASARMSARAVLATASYLNCHQWRVPSRFPRLRSGRNAFNESGIMDRWRAGERNASRSAKPSDELRTDMRRWRRCLPVSPAKST